MGRRQRSFFRGSELPYLLVLASILICGLSLFLVYARFRPRPAQPPLVVAENPRPIVPDTSVEFETVTDRTPMSFRDNAAYSVLLARARERTPEALARETRRDVLMTHLWEQPAHYRGVPIHVEGTALRALRYESKLSKTGWLYEVWVNDPDIHRIAYVCVFEDPPPGFPLGENVSEAVVFNGYFLKILKYEAHDVSRGAPVLVGRIGWRPHGEDGAAGSGSTLQWTLIILGCLIFVNLMRWLVRLAQFLRRRGTPAAERPPAARTDSIEPVELDRWLQSVSSEGSDDAALFEEAHPRDAVATDVVTDSPGETRSGPPVQDGSPAENGAE